MTFNTIEDVNGTVFDNQGFWWYELDLTQISMEKVEGWSVKIDFCTLRYERLTRYGLVFTLSVDNPLWNGKFFNFPAYTLNYDTASNKIFWFNNVDTHKLLLYMGKEAVDFSINQMAWVFEDYLNYDARLFLTLKELKTEQSIGVQSGDGLQHDTVSQLLVEGINPIYYNYQGRWDLFCGYLLVKLLKTDFKFNCNQQLTVGEVNTVQLGTDSDYKPNGDLVGEYTTKLSVLYDNKTIPVVWNSQLNDYTFDLDLTNLQEEKRVRFKVIVETNDVLNASETDVALDCKFETIDTLAKLTNLFRTGGNGRLSESIQLTNDLTLSKSVNLIGNNKVLLMSQHKIVVPSDLTFKAESVCFQQGVNTIQQEPNSTVELTDCTFTVCTGFGSVIDCQVDLVSLDDSDDFNTKLTNCTISNCDMAILHGGNLEVNGCSVIGKISNKNYPYFLYQTDGNATILNSQFNLRDTRTTYNYDLEFNTCIFVCGETATINGYSHSELQNNNLTAFFDTQRNTSTIDVKYYYSLIEDTVHLQSNKGFCHSVSGIDFVYKTNITLTRGE